VPVTRTTKMRGFRAYLTEPHDGDTFRVMTDGGFDGRGEPWLRLLDTRAPELNMRLPEKSQPGGVETTIYTNSWLTAAKMALPERRWYLSMGVVMTETLEPDEKTTFRRYVARVFKYADWPDPWMTPPPDESLSLNAAVTAFVAAHPAWPVGA
jgi:hypothetical protein